jgi:hypothetical protein
MKIKENFGGDHVFRIQDDISSLLLTATSKIGAGTIEVDLYRDGQMKQNLVAQISILALAELFIERVMILKTAISSISIPLSNKGNIEISGDDYIQVTIRGLVTATANTATLYQVEEFFGNDTANEVRVETVLIGSKSKNIRLMGADFVGVQVSSALQTVELSFGVKTITMNVEELKRVAMNTRPNAFYIQETTADAYFKSYYVIPTNNASNLNVMTDGSVNLDVNILTYD